jgi:hypothetical protein
MVQVGEIVCQVLCGAKCEKSTAFTTEFTEGTEFGRRGADFGPPPSPCHTRAKWRLKRGRLARCSRGRAKARPFIRCGALLRSALTFRGAVSSIA